MSKKKALHKKVDKPTKKSIKAEKAKNASKTTRKSSKKAESKSAPAKSKSEKVAKPVKALDQSPATRTKPSAPAKVAVLEARTPTVVELRQQAKARNISGYSRLNKAELIAVLG